MSRFVHSTDEGSVHYGFDRVPEPGYFFQIWKGGDLVREADTRPLMAIGGEVMGRPEMASELEALGVPEEHHQRIMLDLKI